jgi:outer membrane protein TolC
MRMDCSYPDGYLRPRMKFCWKSACAPILCLWAVSFFGLAGGIALGQAAPPNAPSASMGSSDATTSNSGPSTFGLPVNSSLFSGSVPEGRATGDVLPISFKEAIDRGLRNNLGLLVQGDNLLSARGEKWKELSNLLPNVTTTTTQSVAQIDLAAQGIRFNLPGIPTVIGPIGIFQTSVTLQQSVLDLHAFNKVRSAKASEGAARFNYKDARDLVVLATGNAYLQALSYSASVETAQAQVSTAQALHTKTMDQQNAGVIPAIDALRARVELQTRQQQLIAARNNFAKQKLVLARVIGLPSGQEFSLSDTAPYAPLAAMTVEQALQRAYAARTDFQAAQQQVRAAEFSRKAATAEYYPSLGVGGDFGAAGVNLGDSHGVFQVGATLTIPIFQGGKVHGNVLQAEGSLRQSRQQLESLRGQIDYDVRTALLDLASAADQVEVARSSVDLANQTLTQAQDRFTAGVTDNLEVVQAQESVASANENYIASLYAHNLAKVELARAIGFAEEGVRLYLQSK